MELNCVELNCVELNSVELNSVELISQVEFESKCSRTAVEVFISSNWPVPLET